MLFLLSAQTLKVLLSQAWTPGLAKFINLILLMRCLYLVKVSYQLFYIADAKMVCAYLLNYFGFIGHNFAHYIVKVLAGKVLHSGCVATVIIAHFRSAATAAVAAN